jgi:hypothetical protein
MAAPKLISQEDRARSQGTHGSAGGQLNTEVRSRATGHVVMPEPTCAGGVVQSYSLRGSTWMHVMLFVLA